MYVSSLNQCANDSNNECHHCKGLVTSLSLFPRPCCFFSSLSPLLEKEQLHPVENALMSILFLGGSLHVENSNDGICKTLRYTTLHSYLSRSALLSSLPPHWAFSWSIFY